MSEHAGDPDTAASLWFNQPCEITDAWALYRFSELGLGDKPSIADRVDAAIESFLRVDLTDALGIILGRGVSSDELDENSILRDIARGGMEDPEAAVAVLATMMQESPHLLLPPAAY